ncbi:Hypothetical protein NTJ_00129 [Nesidiocoris tenuis]|uniref:Integrase catalytic domain-containing protein n=1 Tax=Nesidiocoris tenuis TaxID=355587 RepID=A0ABN7A5F8_9HEMI|nr:Hypothetical protein NTJ_00129 [Nesidiocoris tenuis]
MGPVYVHSGKSATKVKAYVAIFVCFSVKACHLELVSDLSTSAFLGAFKRFISRRGVCAKIYSDNGTNFVGAKREMKKLLFDYEKGHSITDLATSEGVEWHMIPPGSPHFGGLWESAVKTAKYHFQRMMRSATLTIEEMTTLLCQIEACLNSRPLTYISNDITEFSPLTPAHFLVGGPLHVPDEINFKTEIDKYQKKWIQVQRYTNQFWRLWSKSYLTSLQQRTKWKEDGINARIGTIVMIEEPNLHPTQWKLGRIEEVHPGKDGRVRVATVRLANNSMVKRTVTKLCPLPIQKSDEEIDDLGSPGENVQDSQL